jgi:plastocyanin
VSTEAQFDGQRAMYERRRLIDEVIQTGVPATAATESERSSSAALALLYLLIPLAVIFFLASNRPEPAATTEGQETTTTEGGGGPSGNTIVAEDLAFNVEELEVAAGEEASYTLENRDSVVHNFAVYEDEEATGEALYTSPDAAANASVDFTFTAPRDRRDYTFICDYHPTMKGTLTVTR